MRAAHRLAGSPPLVREATRRESEAQAAPARQIRPRLLRRPAVQAGGAQPFWAGGTRARPQLCRVAPAEPHSIGGSAPRNCRDALQRVGFSWLGPKHVGPNDYDNWEFVAYDKDMNFYYVDPSSILKKEEGLLFKELRDYSEPKEGGKSRVAFFFADCEKLAIREILVGVYKEKGAEGGEIDAYQLQPKWLQVSNPNTVGNLILNYVYSHFET